jgi:hypothetical protein
MGNQTAFPVHCISKTISRIKFRVTALTVLTNIIMGIMTMANGIPRIWMVNNRCRVLCTWVKQDATTLPNKHYIRNLSLLKTGIIRSILRNDRILNQYENDLLVQ